MERLPDSEQGHKVGTPIAEAGMRLVRLLLLVERPLPWVLDAQALQPESPVRSRALRASGLDQHARQAGIKRKSCHHAPDGSQPAMVIDRPQLSQNAEGVFYGSGRRRIQERKVLNTPQPQKEHPQDDFSQVGTEDFGRRVKRDGRDNRPWRRGGCRFRPQPGRTGPAADRHWPGKRERWAGSGSVIEGCIGKCGQARYRSHTGCAEW